MVNSAKRDSEDRTLALAHDVRRLAGPLDDETVAQVLKVGASFAELEIAAAYVRGQGSLVDRAGHPLTGKVAQLYEILSADQDEPEA